MEICKSYKKDVVGEHTQTNRHDDTMVLSYII